MSAREGGLVPFVLEIGVEEMPYWAVEDGEAQLAEGFARLARDGAIDCANLRVLAGPRRFAVLCDLAPRQRDREVVVKGPAAHAAFDADGRPTKAAEGFARAQGVRVEELVVREEGGGRYAFAVKTVIGAPTGEYLREALPKLILDLSFRKAMRWTDGPLRFVRPIRWLVCLLGDEVVPFALDRLVAGRLTRGHRILAPGSIEIAHAGEYERVLEERGRVVADPEKRRGRILAEAERVCPEGARPIVHEAVLEEVAQLVEYPTGILGHFDEEFLSVPEDVLITAMEHHQRYFPVRDRETGRLLPYFVVIQNGDPAREAIVREGNERVIRARLADARFFFEDDMKRPLESLVPKLEGVVFQKKLGTLLAKTARVVELAGLACDLLGCDAETRRHAERAAYLAKADLLTDMVGEFPELQGVMGREYALRQGEPEAVAVAIYEHYLPRFAGDELPATPAGAALSLADRVDTIVGYFLAGLEPSGSEDPYSLRRQGQGCAQIVLARGADFDLERFLDAALEGYAGLDGLRDRGEARAALVAFFAARFERALRAEGHAPDGVAAVSGAFLARPATAAARLAALESFAAEGRLEDVVTPFQRVRNLSKPELGLEVDEARFVDEAERALHAAVVDAEHRLPALGPREALSLLASLRPVVDAFFDAVLVMDPDEAVRANRLRLLNRARALYESFADFSAYLG